MKKMFLLLALCCAMVAHAGTVTGGTEVTLSSYTSSGGGPGGRP